MMKKLIVACAALATFAASGHANIVSNGGFETGDFTGWTVNPSSSYPWGITGNAPTDGSFSATTGCVGSQCTDQNNLGSAAYFYQDLSTVANGVYTLTFDFTPNSGVENELKVLFGDTVVADLIDKPNTALVGYTVTGLVAGGATTRLTFLGRQDPGFDRLDNIAVEQTGTATAAVPEPASWAMMLGGFGLVGGALRSRRKAAVRFA